MRVYTFVFTISLAAGCGATVDTGGTSNHGGGGSAGGNQGGGGSAGGNQGGGGSGGGSFCPPNEPAGQKCNNAPSGFRCTYGDSVRPECRHEWTCIDDTWTTTKSVCVEPPPADCGKAQPTAGTVCPADGDVCTYGSTICLCTSCTGPCMAPPPKWTCAPPPSTAGCPETVPNDGSPCDKSGLSCTYGIACSGSGAQVVCKNGAWFWNQEIACPL